MPVNLDLVLLDLRTLRAEVAAMTAEARVIRLSSLALPVLGCVSAGFPSSLSVRQQALCSNQATLQMPVRAGKAVEQFAVRSPGLAE